MKNITVAEAFERIRNDYFNEPKWAPKAYIGGQEFSVYDLLTIAWQLAMQDTTDRDAQGRYDLDGIEYDVDSDHNMHVR